MTAPAPSRLDANQVLQGSFDESTGRLRTDSLATVVNADIDVALDATEDNVAAWISDENGNPFTDVNYVPVGQATHDNLNANANIQQNNIDVGAANPLYTQTTNGSLEATQQEVLTELQFANASLDAIESDTDFIRIAAQSIDADIDVPLSTRATEATQLLNYAELQSLNTLVDINNNLYLRVFPLLANANFLKLGNFDTIDQSYLGNVATLTYKEDTFEIAKAIITFTSPTSWDIDLIRYILDDDGSKLLDDDDTELFLE